MNNCEFQTTRNLEAHGYLDAQQQKRQKEYYAHSKILLQTFPTPTQEKNIWSSLPPPGRQIMGRAYMLGKGDDSPLDFRFSGILKKMVV